MSASTANSNISRSSNSSRCTTPKPEPKTDCERRRLAIERLERQDIMINGYKKYMLQERTNNKEQSVAYYSLEEALQETLEAKEKLVMTLLGFLMKMSASTANSNISRSSNSSRCTTPKPEPKTDCERRRLAIERIERQDIMINGYKKYMLQERTNNKEQSPAAYYGLEEGAQETLEAKEKLVSELGTLPPMF
ncbi:hypothetical protein TNIN_438791 [Trichonephila inaurata madagascariensis]|uniref:Uncharacterized protein n=1 Tax=Trichonephila inaurata madagascariensis TaxID=2747483 RepID=A0A8X6J680_9ARAC|nr:hypothetical protein TNIN_438791 [Trichonephila inaurata madagascariensis]